MDMRILYSLIGLLKNSDIHESIQCDALNHGSVNTRTNVVLGCVQSHNAILLLSYTQMFIHFISQSDSLQAALL